MENKKMYIIVIAIIIVLLLVFILMMTKKKENKKEVMEEMLNINYQIDGNETSLEQYNTENPIVAMYIEDYGSVVIELYPEVAKNTVNNFN